MAANIPVLVGAGALAKVQSLVVNEGYKAASMPDSPLVQMVSPSTKTVAIEAFLVDAERAFRPASRRRWR